MTDINLTYQSLTRTSLWYDPMARGLGEGGYQMYRQAQLCVQSRDWREGLFGLITDSRGALLDQPGMKCKEVASTLDYLRKAADWKWISFYT
jgi:hypothetical protein